MKTLPTPSTTLGQWLGYSGMATAFLAVAPKAEAQIVSTDLDPDVVLTNSDLDIDFDNDGVVDLNITHYQASGTFSSIFSSFAAGFVSMNGGALIGQVGNYSIYPSVLASGAPIAPADPNFQEIGSQSSSGTALLALKFQSGSSSSVYGNWNGQSGFLGCRFMGGDGQVHYGWVQLSVSTGVANITVMAYGYETMPDMAINAGDMGGGTGLTDAMANAFQMDVMPNPTTDRAVITLPETRTAEMRISLLNSTGQMLFTDKVGTADRYTVNLEDQSPGVYFVSLQDGGKMAFHKVAKQ